MTSIIDEMVAEAKETYSKMSLLELLAHENAMRKLMYSGRINSKLRVLYKILSSEIERKLQ